MANLAAILKKPCWLLALTLSSASALAQTSYVECNFSANAAGLLEIGDYKLIRSAFSHDPAADSCNRSFSATRGVSYGDETAEGTVNLVNKLQIINDSYVFTSVATTSGSASLSLPPNYRSNVHGISNAYSSIKIVSDGPVSYHFSASFVELSAHSPGQHQTDRLTFKTTLGSEAVLGDLYPGDTYIGSEYQEEGYLTLGPDNLAIIEVKGQSDGGQHLSFYDTEPFSPLTATDLGTYWSYRLVVSPVPEPASHLMLLSGILCLIFWRRKHISDQN